MYAYAADPAHLPAWAGGLARSTVEQVDGHWVVESPMGRVRVELAPVRPRAGMSEADLDRDCRAVATDLETLRSLLEDG